jgi:hypothetical protein
MKFKCKIPGVFRCFALILISLAVCPLLGQQAVSVPVITLISPSSADSLNNSGRILVKAEIVSQIPLQSYRIMLNESVFADEIIFKLNQKDSKTYIIDVLVPLNEGRNTIYIEAKNAFGTTKSEKCLIESRLEPFITWLTPTLANTTVDSGIINIKAEIKTGYPLQKVTMNINGTVSSDEKSAIFQANNDTYLFEKTLLLKPGRNSINISASNIKGRTPSATRNINFLSGSKLSGSKPVISLVSPSPNDSLNNSGIILVKAEIVSQSPLQKFTLINNNNVFSSITELKPEQKDNKTYIVESLVPLKKGQNTIYVEAKNSAGTTYSENRVIDSRLEPLIIWLLPAAASSTVESGTTNIKAEIRTILPLKNISMNLNGTLSALGKEGARPLNNDTYILETTIELKTGRNTIYLSAVNTKGETRSVTKIINFGSAPVINLVSPSPADSLNNSGRILVRAEVVSQSALQTYRIIHNDDPFVTEAELKPVKKDNITYIIESLVPLNEGQNTIYVEVKNANGTGRSEKLYITSQIAPFVTWLSPSFVNSVTESGTVNIKAEIKTLLELQNVRLNLNGKVIASEQGEITRLNNDTYIFERTLQNVLSTKNTISLTAANSSGKTNSSSRNISYLSGLKPVITIAPTDSLNNSGIVQFSSEIVSRTALQAVRLIHNGIITVLETTKNPEKKDSITYIVKGLIPLRAGLNTFYLEAKNTIGTTSSEKYNIICKPEPIIKWILPASTFSTAVSGTLNIRAEIITSYDLLNVSVNLNGTLIAGQKDGISRVNNETYILERVVSLKAGENNLTLTASNARGPGFSTMRNISYVPGIVSEIKWIAPFEANSDTRKPEFSVIASIISQSNIKNVRVNLNGTDLTAGDRSKITKKNTQEYSYENTLTLRPGTNTIELSAITSEGTVTSEKRTITYTIPALPVLAWNNPVSDRSEVNQAALDIRMNIKSDDELNNISVYLNGKPLDNVSLLNSVRKENEIFVLGSIVILKPGDNILYVSAGNIAGPATSETRNIKYTVPSMPVIAWENPGTGVSAQSAQTITVTANITSTTQLKDLKIYHNDNPLPGNPVVSTIDKQQGVYHVEGNINLNQGENRIYIVAGNMAGNTTSETRSVSYVAAATPVIAWVKPSDPSTLINLTSAEISATVKSSERLQSIFVYVNGVGSEEINQVSSSGTPGEYNFKKTINLQPGNNTIYLSVTNSIGTNRSEDRLLTNPQASKPAISWAIPSEPNIIVNSDMLIVEACIKSSTELKSAQIFVNGVQWASETLFQAPQPGDCNYRLTKSVLLKEGDNTVIINATNFAGSEISDRRLIRFQTGVAERRLALIIGNANYGNSMILKNPVNDANLMEGTLKSLGFEVIKRLNATKGEIEKAVWEFSKKLPEYNVALFYYAGHGIQVEGENYLIPVDAVLEEKTDCKFQAVAVNFIVDEFEKVPENINIVILDACRSNPFRSWVRGGEQGFRMLNTVSGTFVSFATSEGATAADGIGQNGTFTEELVKQMLIPQSIFNVFVNTRNQVMKRTNNIQQPEEKNKLSGDFFFKR